MTVCKKCKRKIYGMDIRSCGNCGEVMCEKCAAKGYYLCSHCLGEMRAAH